MICRAATTARMAEWTARLASSRWAVAIAVIPSIAGSPISDRLTMLWPSRFTRWRIGNSKDLANVKLFFASSSG